MSAPASLIPEQITGDDYIVAELNGAVRQLCSSHRDVDEPYSDCKTCKILRAAAKAMKYVLDSGIRRGNRKGSLIETDGISGVSTTIVRDKTMIQEVRNLIAGNEMSADLRADANRALSNRRGWEASMADLLKGGACWEFSSLISVLLREYLPANEKRDRPKDEHAEVAKLLGAKWESDHPQLYIYCAKLPDHEFTLVSFQNLTELTREEFKPETYAEETDLKLTEEEKKAATEAFEEEMKQRMPLFMNASLLNPDDTIVVDGWLNYTITTLQDFFATRHINAHDIIIHYTEQYEPSGERLLIRAELHNELNSLLLDSIIERRNSEEEVRIRDVEALVAGRFVQNVYDEPRQYSVKVLSNGKVTQAAALPTEAANQSNAAAPNGCGAP